MRLGFKKRSPVFDVETDPQAIGLESFHMPTAFGSMHFVGHRQRQADEVILFIHGLGGSWQTWTPVLKAGQAAQLFTGRDVLLVDLPSFGQSENKPGHLKTPELGLALRKAVKDLGYGRLHVVGHSMGGFLTLDMAARLPMVASAGVVAGSYFHLLHVSNNLRSHALQSPAIVAFYGLQQIMSYHPRTTKAANTISKALGSMFEVGGQGFAYASQNSVGYDPHGMWGHITAPVRAVFGEKDSLVTEKDMEELKSVLPHAHVSMLAGAGHTMMLDHPAEVAAALFGPDA